MAKTPPKKPTEAELEILQVLWTRGPSTVRQVFDELGESRGVGHTTFLKLMQIMAEKGLVTRDESVRPQVYRASRSRGATQKDLMADILERIFRGSPGKLVLQALASKPSTAEERREIRELLDRLEAEAAEPGSPARGDREGGSSR